LGRKAGRRVVKAGARSRRNAAWIEKHIRVPEGRFVGKPLKLTKAQRLWLSDIYDTPTRLYILSLGRKNSKTAFSAIITLLHLVGPEAKANSQLFSGAQSRDQAALIFDLAAKMVRLSPDLSAYVLIRDAAKQLACPELGTLYRALSAEASTAFGLSPALVVHDELGQVRGPRSEFYEALETAAGAQAEPLSIIISTQSPNDTDLLSVLIEDAKTGTDPRIKVRIYEAPMDADPFSEEAIRAANPNYDDFMNKDEVRRQAEEARRMPSREPAFRNLVLNQRVESKSPFISRSVWDENGATPASLKGQKVYGGLDLASVSDLCGLVLLSAAGDIHATCWLPEEGLAEKSRVDRVPYDMWAKQGHLQTTPGRAVEYEFIAEYLRGVFDEYTIERMAFDRYNMKFLKPWLERVGFTEKELEKFVEFGQGFISMSPALRAMESKLLAKKYKHGKHPVLSMCAANATIVMDPAGNRKFVKSRATGRIDLMVALAMAEGVMPNTAEAPKQYQVLIL
jgi:phage terminase large subunit-like protein